MRSRIYRDDIMVYWMIRLHDPLVEEPAQVLTRYTIYFLDEVRGHGIFQSKAHGIGRISFEASEEDRISKSVPEHVKNARPLVVRNGNIEHGIKVGGRHDPLRIIDRPSRVLR